MSAIPNHPAFAMLEDAADRSNRLPPPNSHNPHAFHEARSELANDIRSALKWLKTGNRPD